MPTFAGFLRLAAFTCGAALATVSLAAEQVTLTVHNKTSAMVDAFNAFAVDKDGDPVEDNLGGLMEDLAVGATATLELSISRCDKVWLNVDLADGRHIEGIVDTCADRVVNLTD